MNIQWAAVLEAFSVTEGASCLASANKFAQKSFASVDDEVHSTSQGHPYP